jgi:hypothetical protein
VAGPGGATELLGTKPSTLDVSHFATWYRPRNASLRIPTLTARWSNLSERIDPTRRSGDPTLVHEARDPQETLASQSAQYPEKPISVVA